MDNLSKSKDSLLYTKPSGRLRNGSIGENNSRDTSHVEGIKWKAVKRGGTAVDTSVDLKRTTNATKIKAKGQEKMLIRVKGFNDDKTHLKSLRD